MNTLADLHRAAEARAGAGDWAQAAAQCRAILEQSPDDARARYGLGDALYQLDQCDEALIALRRAVELDAGNAQCHYKLGNVLKDLGHADAAIEHFERAIALAPVHAQALNNLGVVLESRHRYQEATERYRQAIRADPHLHPAQTNLAALLSSYGDAGEAARLYEAAIEAQPEDPALHVRYAHLLAVMDRPAEAAAAAGKALALAPGFLDAEIALCWIDDVRGDKDKAIACYTRLLERGAESAALQYSLGNCHADRGDFDQAERCFNRALALQPAYADAHFSLASLHLAHGRFAQGWDEYEWRWQLPQFLERHPGAYARPLWDAAQPLHGKTLLVHAEQGFGDTLQFVRYLPLLHARGGKLLVQCPASLQRLVCGMPGVSAVTAKAEAGDYDFHVPLLSLPRAFGTRLDSIPADVPYLAAPRELVQRWQDRLADVPGFKVGLTWNSHSPAEANKLVAATKSIKSVLPEMLAPLLDISGASFVSLQKSEGAPLAWAPRGAANCFDWSNEFDDFANTAALVESLDLVISIDTAVAHLAGALGKPVWTLLRHNPDWRWLRERTTSPWYPTMRLFRQARANDWAGVVQAVRAALVELVASRNPAGRPDPAGRTP